MAKAQINFGDIESVGSEPFTTTFTASDLSSGSKTVDTGISNPKIVILYCNPSAGNTSYALYYDVENNTVSQTYYGAFESATNNPFSFNGSALTYTVPSNNWKVQTRILVV